MKICDCHNDFLTEMKTIDEKRDYIRETVLKNKCVKIACVVWCSRLKSPVEFIKKNFDIIKNVNKKISLKAMPCVEDIGFVVNENKVDYNALKEIVSINPFSCGLVWNYDNGLGGGAFGKSRLTEFGKQVIKILESNNILVDTAHMNKKTFYDFVKITSKPIYNSHSNIYSYKKHKRNLTDKQIKTVINSGGFIGLSFVCKFISDKIVDCNKVALQIKYFVDNFGCYNVGIGSDFYGTDNLPVNLKRYSDLKNLKKSLKIVGLKSYQIKNIFYKNFIRFQKLVNK